MGDHGIVDRAVKDAVVVNVKRACNGCGRELRPAYRSECDAAIFGRPLPDVRSECPDCKETAGL